MRSLSLFLLALLLSIPALPAQAQSRDGIPSFLLDPSLFSSRIYEKKSTLDGNEVAITNFNTGLLGGVGEVRGNWPKGSEDFYVGDVLPVIVAEVPIDLTGDGVPDTLVQHAVTVRGPRAGTNSPPTNPNIFWGFEPKPNFAAPEPNDRTALSTDPTTWPNRWPDQPTWIDPSTGEAEWNGFFGRGQFNADLETYYWIDDANNAELNGRYPQFRSDSTDRSRDGLGLAMSVRALQWSQFLAQDAIFFLYELTNTSTTTYPRVAAGLTVGTLAGGDGDSQDDLAFFDQANRIVYSYDNDNSGNERQEVGYVGYGFLESPGDGNNAIDDDGDGDPSTELGRDIDGLPFADPSLVGDDNTFQEADFTPRALAVGDPLIAINPDGSRSIFYLESGGTTITSQGRTVTLRPGDVVEEDKSTIRGQLEDVEVTTKNLIDEDFDGLIDEDVNLHFTRRAQTLQGDIATLPALRFKNYVGLARAVQGRAAVRADSVRFGLLNPMIDERRDDGIDNDGDWRAATDDLGADGVAGTGDAGEGDGVPSPGEPSFDALDVSESDQVGLTSFFYFTPPGALQMNNDERLWEALNPGFFTTNDELQQQQSRGGVDGDFIFGSGYFDLEPGETIRFTMALVFGNDLQDITNNTQTIQEIYNRNYQFARPPDRPTLRAVPGDGRVTLYWDTIAEESVDPILGRDFQGYRVYKSTDPFFRDPEVITDGTGTEALIAPFAQYDLRDGLEGFWPAYTQPDFSDATSAEDSIRIQREYIDAIQRLTNRTRGTPYYIGDDTGLRHSLVDTLVDNGRRYYYAITAYDRGSDSFYPAENNLAVTVTETGDVITGANVVEIIPNAPVAGFESGGLSVPITASDANRGTGEVFAEVLDARPLMDGVSYAISFGNPTGEGPTATTFTVTRSDGEEVARDVPLARAEGTVFDGLRLDLRNDALRLNVDETGYVGTPGDTIFVQSPFTISQFGLTGSPQPFDYEIRFGEPSQSSAIRLGSRGPTAPVVQTSFSVVNATTGQPAPFAFIEGPSTRDGDFNALNNANEAIFIYQDVGGTLTPVAAVRTDSRGDRTFVSPPAGAVYRIETFKPFSTSDRFTFGVRGSAIDEDAAREQIERVAVVPNPYVGAASWEAPLPPTQNTGRGERRVDFIHLPQNATIRIYSARGEFVRELVHTGGLTDGSVSWDLRTREGLDVAYGVYFYHVRTPDGLSKSGKLAIIK
jgi:hypothetical protein